MYCVKNMYMKHDIFCLTFLGYWSFGWQFLCHKILNNEHTGLTVDCTIQNNLISCFWGLCSWGHLSQSGVALQNVFLFRILQLDPANCRLRNICRMPIWMRSQPIRRRLTKVVLRFLQLPTVEYKTQTNFARRPRIGWYHALSEKEKISCVAQSTAREG